MTLRGCQCDKAQCPECGPLVALAAEICREYDDTRKDARVPTPEIVWWRAQMRARQDASRAAARPIVFTQAIAIAALIGLLASVATRLTLPAISWTDMTPALVASLPLLRFAVIAAVLLVAAPVAVYFALSRD
jgi:hypothetical protein